jgi:hypothetical protein
MTFTNKRKKALYLFFLTVISISCCTYPQNFIYYFYSLKDMKCNQTIDTEGYYITQRECDTMAYSIFRFYPNGEFSIATTNTISPELINCFTDNTNNRSCDYLLHGVYAVEGDTVKTQIIWPADNKCTIFCNYRILSDGYIVNISEYAHTEYPNRNLKGYPSFYNNPCEKKALFHPFTNEKR